MPRLRASAWIGTTNPPRISICTGAVRIRRRSSNGHVPDARTRDAWANVIDTTEAGAYACALAAVELADGLVAVRRAETLTGADYYVAPPGNSPDDLEECLRLEVSGVDRGPERAIEQRLGAKLAQAAAGNSNLPALASVVGFKTRLIMLADLKL